VYDPYPKVRKATVRQSSHDACQINNLETIVNETGPEGTRVSKFWTLPDKLSGRRDLNRGSNFWIDGDISGLL